VPISIQNERNENQLQNSHTQSKVWFSGCGDWSVSIGSFILPNAHIPSMELDLATWVDAYPLLCGVLVGTIVYVVVSLISDFVMSKMPSKSAARSRDPIQFTLPDLLLFNGVKSPENADCRIYVSLRGTVFDVSSASNFYGISTFLLSHVTVL
jgi:hypothetical protein